MVKAIVFVCDYRTSSSACCSEEEGLLKISSLFDNVLISQDTSSDSRLQ